MLVGIRNTPREYAWGFEHGNRRAVGNTRDRSPRGRILARHTPGIAECVGRVCFDRSRNSTVGTHDAAISPESPCGAAPLSPQAHPTTAQVRRGFERENALGIPLDAPSRNYKDAIHKPELIYALSSEFAALCGFRPVAQTRRLIQALGADSAVADLLRRLGGDDDLRSVFEWLISRSAGVDELVTRVVDLARARPEPEFVMVGELADAYPGDPGIVIALLLNRVVLRPGQVLYLPAGNIHAYLRGVGIELMAASDNVLRGGLTPKHVDVAELLAVLDFHPGAVPLLAAEHPVAGVEVFRPDVPDFELAVVNPTGGSTRFAPRGNRSCCARTGSCESRARGPSIGFDAASPPSSAPMRASSPLPAQAWCLWRRQTRSDSYPASRAPKARR